MKRRKIRRIFIKSTPHLPELIIGSTYFLDSNGVEEFENELVFYLNSFSEQDELFLKNFLNGLVKENILEKFEVHTDELYEKNWNKAWEESIESIKVTERIVIKPSFKNYDAYSDEIVITIDPKMSFGTGHHQSTRLMIRLLEKYIRPGVRVLDAGTGSGILAIVSAVLGASEVLAFDLDENVEDNFTENCEKNNVSDKCKFFAGTIENIREGDFDIVLANIQRNVLIEMANQIKEKLKIGGLAILSGLLFEDKEEINQVYSSLNFSIVDKIHEDEWIGLVYKKVE